MRSVIKAGRIITGTDRPPIERGVVVVDGSLIKAVGREDEVSIPSDVEVIDRGEETLLPGLVDAHSHVSVIPGLGDQIGQLRAPAVESLLRAVANLRADLKSGVTTMRVLGEEHFIDIELKRAIEAGQIPGPRLVVAGRQIVASNGHGAALTVTDGVDEVRKRVRENLRAGADVIKLFMTGGVSSPNTNPTWYSYTPEEVEAAVEESHRCGKLVAVHAHGGPGVRICLDAGVDSIEHGALLTLEELELMVQRGTWLVVNHAISHHPEGIEKGDAHEPTIMEKLLQSRRATKDKFRLILESGVKYAVGTDSMHGYIWFEFEMLVELGATPMEALLAGTRRAAEAIGLLDKVGTLEPGKYADIISVQGNPLDDITAMRRIGLVMKGGRRYDQISLL